MTGAARGLSQLSLEPLGPPEAGLRQNTPGRPRLRNLSWTRGWQWAMCAQARCTAAEAGGH